MTLLEAVSEVARLAGATALAHFRRPVAIDMKQDGSPVTVADREAELAARAWIEARFPEDGIVGEEHGVLRPDARRRWFIDPIDGTKAFVRGVPLWGTLVAVAEGDEVLAGAMSFPATGEHLAAERGAGCHYDGGRTRVSSVTTLREATVLTTDAAGVPAWLAPTFAGAGVARTWGDCYGYLLVATGRAELMVDPVLSPWDSAALMPIIEEAGGVFTDARGRRTAFGGSAIASNGRIPLPRAPEAEAGGPTAQAAAVRAMGAPAAGGERPRVAVPAGLDFSKGGGLVTVVAQDALTGEVLMVAHADAEALEQTAATGLMHYRSRTRGLWLKGGTSGNVQRVRALTRDCDGDAVLASVVAAGPACHDGTRSCFATSPAPDALGELDRTIAARAKSPVEGSYTNRLLRDRNLRLKKLGEETAELVVALADGDTKRSAEESADLVYHLVAALQAQGLSLDAVRAVLARRAEERAQRSLE